MEILFFIILAIIVFISSRTSNRTSKKINISVPTTKNIKRRTRRQPNKLAKNFDTVSNKKSIDSKQEDYISTTAVGKKLNIAQKDIIEFFIHKKLLTRINNKLTLTHLGKEYRGKQHISGSDSWTVWPESIINKPLFKNIKINQIKVEKTIQSSFPISSDLQDMIIFYGKYHPYHGGNNPEFDQFSGKILDLKSDRNNAVTYFFNLIKDVNFDNTQVIVIVPSHTPSNKMSSVRKLAIMLAKYKNWVDATDSIVRTHEIAKLAYGGNRSIDTQLSSLRVKNIQLLKNRNVLVFDDVTTSGNSLYATMQLLHNINVKSVWSYAVAHTD